MSRKKGENEGRGRKVELLRGVAERNLIEDARV